MNSFFWSHRESVLVKVGYFVYHMTSIYHRNCLVVAKILVKTRSWYEEVKWRYGLLFAAMWKRNTKKIFSVLFPQQLDDRGSMRVAKIWTNKTPVSWWVQWSLKFSDSLNSLCTMGACLQGLRMIQFSGLCVFRAQLRIIKRLRV